jgi:hypothetical protein
MPSTQLLLYGFGPDASFEGQLVGALQRIESGGTVRVIDGLFIRRDPESDELNAIRVGADASALLGFRLDPAERRRATERTLAGGAGAIPPETARELAAALAPGAALAAILVEHAWADALEDAVARTGGTRLASSFGDATRLADLADELLAAAARAGR